MQFLATKRPITQKFLSSLALQHRPNFGSSNSSSHLVWRNLLSNEVDDTTSDNYSHNVPKDVVILRTKTCKIEFLKSLRSSCRLIDGKVILGERRSHGLSKNSGVTWIAAWKSNAYLEGDPGGRKFGRRGPSNDKDRWRYIPSRSSKTNGDEEGSGHNNNSYDAILVLAGGQVAGGGVPVWVEKRLDKALDLQRSNNGVFCKIVCLGGGTPHRAPILSSEGFVVHESSSCAEYLHSRGAPFSHLLKEWGSYDTIGNGYFSLTQHVIPRRWRTLAVVTSEFHMPRTRAIFEWIFGLQGADLALPHEQLGPDVGVTATRSRAQGFQLDFHSVPDQGVIEESVLQARLEKERCSIENLRVIIQQIDNLEDFHEWFHTDHKAYNTEDQHLFGKEETPDPALLLY